MRNFRRLAIITVLAVYFLTFVGGIVRVAGAGLGCPDWPKCFGRWIPPLSTQDIPPEIDHSTFNITLAWIEYGNRLVGMSVGLLVLATAIFALRVHRKEPRVLYPALVAALLTAYQGWQGGQVVASELKPLIVSVHLFISFIIVSLLIYVAHQSHNREEGKVSSLTADTGKASQWVLLLWAGGLIQIVLGTLVRGKLQVLTDQLPSLADSQLLAHVGLPHDLHMISGTFLALATVVVGLLILRTEIGRLAMVKLTASGLMILALIQIALGFFFLVFALSPILQLFHLWISGLYIGLTLLLYVALKSGTAIAFDRALSLKRMTVVIVAAVLLMAVGAIWVIQQAKASLAGLS